MFVSFFRFNFNTKKAHLYCILLLITATYQPRHAALPLLLYFFLSRNICMSVIFAVTSL